MNWHRLKTQLTVSLILLSAAFGASAQTTPCAPAASVNLPVVNTGLPVVQIWTTNADHCQHMIALVRTSGTGEDRQKGLSQLIIDLSLPGITIRPIEDLTGDRCGAEREAVRPRLCSPAGPSTAASQDGLCAAVRFTTAAP